MIIGGGHNLVKHKNLRIWAERGMIRIEDAKDNSFRTISVREALNRVKALSDIVKNSTAVDDYFDEVAAQQSLVEDLVRVIKVAQEQGSPDDPSAVRDLKRRQKTQMVVPSMSTASELAI